jgi:hypothetical protein
MKSYYQEMKDIYARLKEIETIINPTGQLFTTINDHPLCKERDILIKKYWELKRYGNSFTNRTNPIVVSMYITGATALQKQINYSVAYNS